MIKLERGFPSVYLYHNTENDLVINVEKIHYRRQVINKLKHRFLTYGYNEIYTSTFEHYDLYANMNGTVNHNEMLKTIDNTGQVLVLRPDITIPITQQIALNNKELHEDLRYFYVLDVFRQTAETRDYREKTQAGVEYFGNPSPEADAEIIALAIHLLEDIQVHHFKIELGHAGFFKQLVHEMNLQKQDLHELKQYIEAKNITEIEQFLNRLSVTPDVKEIVTSLPFLYGNPLEVIEKAKQLPLNDELKNTLQNISEIYHVLRSYGVEQHVVIDLSLINHMDYYSDMIFQGFIQDVGKPILMGGRYNTLADQFGADIPAIGFAYDIDLLLSGVESTALRKMTEIDITIIYEKDEENIALKLANDFRNEQMHVVTYVNSVRKNRIPTSTFTIKVMKKGYVLINGKEQIPFKSIADAIDILNKIRRESN